MINFMYLMMENQKYKPLTVDKIVEIMNELTLNNPPPKIQIIQICTTYGEVIRNEYDLKLCKDKNCPTCRYFEKELDKHMKNEHNKTN